MPAKLIERKDRHLLPDDNAVVIFDQITKTGGLTIDKLLREHYKGKSCQLYQRGVMAFPDMPQDAMHYSEHCVTDVHHLISNDKTAFYFTLVRHPMRWIFSRVRGFLRTQPRSIQDCLKRNMDIYLYRTPLNQLTDWLGNGDEHLAEHVLFERYAYFGITEFFAESCTGLCSVLPWLANETIVNLNMSPKEDRDGLQFSKAAEEYYMERNAKDMRLYDKAVKEFKARYPFMFGNGKNKIIEVRTDKVSYNPPLKNPVNRYQRIFDGFYGKSNHSRSIEERVSGAPGDTVALTRDEDAHALAVLYYNLAANDRNVCKAFYDHMRTVNLPLCRLYAFLSGAKLRECEAVIALGNEVFDAIDALDDRNNVSTLVKIRLEMIDAVVANWPVFKPNSFSDRCFAWLETLRPVACWTATAWHEEATLHDVCGNAARAVDCAEKAVLSEPDSDVLHACLCHMLLKNGNAAKAEAEARLALDVNPECEWAIRQLALALHARGDFVGAEQAFKKALSINPYWWEGRMPYCEILQARGMPEEALDVVGEGARLLPDNTRCAFRYCDLLIGAGRLEQAEEFIRARQESFPHWAYLHKALSIIHKARGEMDAAVASAKAAVENQPQGMEYREYLADILIKAGRLDDLEKDAAENAAAFPEESWPLLFLAKASEARGEIERGLEYARKAYVLQPGKRSLAENLARFLRLNDRQNEFEEFCEKALGNDPEQAWVWREKCRNALALGNPEQAIEFGTKAIALEPGDQAFLECHRKILKG